MQGVFMGLETNVLIAVILRFALIFFFMYLFVFFKGSYQRALKEGFKNKFLLGFTFMFLTLTIIQLFLAIYELLDDTGLASMAFFERNFPGYDDAANRQKMGFLLNFMQYTFIGFLALACLIFAAQVYPLEEIVGWQKTPLTKYLIVLAGLTAVILLPVESLRFSYYSFIIILGAFLGIAIAAFLNFGVNIKLIMTTTGNIRRRSSFVLIGLLIFYFGFIWALEVGWSNMINPEWGLTEDLIFGTLLQMVATFFYRSGFSMSETS
jgi:hypothetical protein